MLIFDDALEGAADCGSVIVHGGVSRGRGASAGEGDGFGEVTMRVQDGGDAGIDFGADPDAWYEQNGCWHGGFVLSF